MQITAYNFEKSPREYVDWYNTELSPFLLNKNNSQINFNPNDYIDATLTIIDKQINEQAKDNDFKSIGGIRTDEKQGDIVFSWFWRVVNRVRIRHGKWSFTLQADVFKNWDISAYPIRATKLNILNNETFRLVQQNFVKYPTVQNQREVVGNSSVAIIYATQALDTSTTTTRPNQFSLNLQPPVLSGLPASGTKYKTNVEINDLYANTGISFNQQILANSSGVWGKVVRVFSNGNLSVVRTRQISSQAPSFHFSSLNAITETNEAINQVAPATSNLNSVGQPIPFPVVSFAMTTPEIDAQNIVNAINSMSAVNQTTDAIPSVITQNAGRLFIQAGKIFRMILTPTTETISNYVNGNSQGTWYHRLSTDSLLHPLTINCPWRAFYSVTNSYTTVTYEEIGVANGIYDIVWGSPSVIPPLSGSSVYAYVFSSTNRDVAEALVSYFYRTYGSIIQDAQLFENLSVDDLETKTELASVTLNSVEQFKIYNIVASTSVKAITSTILQSYLNLDNEEQLYQTCFIFAPDGSSVLEVDKNFNSPIINIEFDLLPIEGKIYARFNYNDTYTGIYQQNTTQKIIMWRAGKYSGSLSAFVEYTLQNSTFQQITNAGFNMTENNNRVLDAQQSANFQYQKNAQNINIEQQKTNAILSFLGGSLGVDVGLAMGNPMALLGGAGLGMNFARQQINMGFQKQQNENTNSQMLYNNGVASMLRANELALSKQVNDLNIQAIRDRPNMVIPSVGISIKRTTGLEICLYIIPTHIANVIRDTINRFGFDIDIVWTYDKSQNIMGQFMYLPFTPRINEFLQSMLGAGLYKENYLPFGDNIVAE